MTPVKNIIEYGRLIDESLDDFADSLTDTLMGNKQCLSFFDSVRLLIDFTNDIYIDDDDLNTDNYSDIDDYSDTDDSDQIPIKVRVQNLAKLFGNLSEPDFSEYKDDICKTDLLKYFNDVLYETSWIKSVLKLHKIDKRIVLYAVNVDYYDPPVGNDSIIIPVYVYEPAWVGEPSYNTLIVGVNTNPKMDKYNFIEEHVKQ